MGIKIFVLVFEYSSTLPMIFILLVDLKFMIIEGISVGIADPEGRRCFR